MAGKTLYEILEVARNATPEIISTAYRVQCDRIDVIASKDPNRASVLRASVDEAYKTLSSSQTRGRYDLRLQQLMVATPVVAVEDDRTWFARHWIALLVAAVALVGTGYLYDKSKRARIAAERNAVEQKALLEKERAERTAEETTRQSQEAALRAKQDRDREYAWAQQVRAQARSNVARRDRQEERDRQLAERQKLTEERKEEAERLRQENEARRNLEREKARLRQLECSRGPC